MLCSFCFLLFGNRLVCMHVFYFIVSYILCSLQQFVNVVFVLLYNHSTIVFGGYCKLPLADFFFFGLMVLSHLSQVDRNTIRQKWYVEMSQSEKAALSCRRHEARLLEKKGEILTLLCSQGTVWLHRNRCLFSWFYS